MSVLRLGAILNREITNEKHKKYEEVPLTRLQRGYLFTVWEMKKEGTDVLSDLVWEHTWQATQIFHRSAFGFKWPRKHYEYWSEDYK